ncbi:hypothetical protein AWL63_18370 [Sphingomonas panacis]|uniref:Uncharacterized protein n=1 Tax=Sphingomonas panacis TaxID=1560345 RepID=A0A1B3ZDV2_9SPHN|nr:hypothetical protein [Sphingomonas panacis]AOH85608.1 hypothetical protein AWL63_18370 [Sphingomonas panacis]
MSFVDEMVENGGHFFAECRGKSATFRPVSDRIEDIESFQTVVRRLREHEGDGYTIFQDHILADHGRGRVDLMVVSIGAG